MTQVVHSNSCRQNTHIYQISLLEAVAVAYIALRCLCSTVFPVTAWQATHGEVAYPMASGTALSCGVLS